MLVVIDVDVDRVVDELVLVVEVEVVILVDEDVLEDVLVDEDIANPLHFAPS